MAKKKGRVPRLSEDFLRTEYIEKGKTAKTIAKENGVPRKHVQYRLQHLGIRREYNRRKLTYEFLFQLYVVEKKSCREIAAICGYRSRTTIREALKNHGIIRRKVRTQEQVMLGARKRRKGYMDVSGSFMTIARNGADFRNLEFSVTAEDVWNKFLEQNRKCALSGVEICFAPTSDPYHRAKIQTVSLDRIDSSKGYTLDNIQLIHKRLQSVKGSLAETELFRWVSLIARFRCGL